MFDSRLMKICPESRKYIIANIIFQWLELALNTAVMIMLANAVMDLYEGKAELSSLIPLVLIIAGCVVLRFFVTKAAVKMSYLASKTVKKVLRETIYKKLMRLSSSYRDHVSTAALVQESTEGVEQLESYFGLYVPQFFYAFLAPLTLFLLFGFSGSWSTAAVLLICVPLIPGAIMMVQKIAKKLLSKYWDQYENLGSTFLENLQGMTTLKTYQADQFKNEQMNEESEKFRVVTMKVLTMQLNSVTIMDFFAYGGAGLGILLASNAFIHQKITLAACIYMILLSAEFFLPMRRLGSYFHVAMNGMAASDKIFAFLNLEEPERKNGVLPESDLSITLDHVSFSYEEDREVLHDISLNIPAGHMTAIVGESGCGKSTIASLIMGRNRLPKGNGTLAIAGMDLSEISEESLMKTVTYTGSNEFLFKGTVRDNLLCADHKADDAALWNALERSGLAAELKEKEGLDTLLAENGSNLSGGQRQRLALARAFLHDTPVYIFDEATSSIDGESEEKIMKEIEKLAEERTVILITHRLANVVHADQTACMEDGYIRETGTHEELLAHHGVYRKLWETQQELETYGIKEKGGTLS